MNMSRTLDRKGQRIVAAMVTTAGLALLAAAPAQAQSNTSAVCTITLPAVTITPPFKPLALTPALGTISSGGETGTVSCVGEIGGDRVTGTGTAGILYAYSNGTCLAHVGLGTGTWTIPTEAGPKHMTGTLSVHRIGLGILAELRFPDARVHVTGAVVPLEGNCVLTPLRKVRVTVAGLLVGP
jgi:hypothetical protein